MRLQTTLSPLAKALCVIAGIAALSSTPASAAFVNWQLISPSLPVTHDFKDATLLRPTQFEANTAIVGAAPQLQYNEFTAQSGPTAETREIKAAALSDKLQARDTDFQQAPPSTISANSQGQSAIQIASTLEQRFSVAPNFQVPSGVFALASAPVASMPGGDPVPVPEMSALLPVVGLLIAVSCTRILRRRRAAQLSTPRNFV